MFTLPQQRLLESARELGVRFGESDVAQLAPSLDDEALLAVLQHVSEAQRALQVLGAVVTAEVSRRSERELGYSGLAQRKGHRTGTDLVQAVTGQTRADVRRAAAVGKDLQDAPKGGSDAGGPGAGGRDAGEPAAAPWHAPLVEALRGGALSREQYDVIRRGLGEPPVERYPDLEPDFLPGAWRAAAVMLIGEASDRGVGDLASAARLARDTLDPIGVQLRFDERFERRSFRSWVDQDGQHHARIVFDDEAAVWVHTILNAGLRPRRGPRFVEAGGAASGGAGAADDDTRSTEQLQYDLLMAVLRRGAGADPTQAFGDRQPGVRIVVPTAAVGAVPAYAEETSQALPLSLAERYRCDAGTRAITVSADGTPLDVGRDKRLFTPRQRVALALRDGGCRWCGAEPSRCEAHHLEHWLEHRGRTDLADGVLLCRSCHMRLHNQGWLITRVGSTFYLHPPGGGEPRMLPARSLLRFQAAALGG
jgi:hypothetical protein